MTPKEKAQELIAKVDSIGDIDVDDVLSTVHLICDEVLKEIDSDNYNGIKYWEEVKDSIRDEAILRIFVNNY